MSWARTSLRLEDQMLPFDTSVYPPVIHSLIIVELPHKKPATVFFNATVRAWKGLDKDAFRRDLVSSELCASIDDWAARSTDDMVKSYQDILCELLDKHATKRTIQKRHRPLGGIDSCLHVALPALVLLSR